jgi:hypothetical protein
MLWIGGATPLKSKPTRRGPVTPSEIRLELLQEHQELRMTIAETRNAAARALTYPSAFKELRACALLLCDRLRTHNRHEEELLQDLLPTVDAWGSVYAESTKEHHSEHEQLSEALAGASDVLEIGVFQETVLSTIDRVLDHMAHEEKAYLRENVLRDDVIVIDQSGG